MLGMILLTASVNLLVGTKASKEMGIDWGPIMVPMP